MRKKDSAKAPLRNLMRRTRDEYRGRLDVIQKGESNECCKDIGNYSIVFQEL
jgi:hypothetical protein